MTAQTRLRSLAAELADDRQSELAATRRKIDLLKAELARKEKEFDAKNEAPLRVASYEPGSIPEFNCPFYWIDDAVKIRLKNHDWDCPKCNGQFEDLTA
jgi:hypothetical protein